MTRSYAICTKAAHEKLKSCFHPQYGSHYLDLPDGRILVQAAFADESGEATFSTHPDVEMLPDPQFEGKTPLAEKHQAALAHLAPEGNTVLHLAKAAGKVHPLMRLRSWL
jgi:hypothetical protein